MDQPWPRQRRFLRFSSSTVARWSIAGLGAFVRQWIHGLRQLLGVFGWLLHIFYVMVFSDPEVDAAPSMLQLLPQLVTLGNWTIRLRVDEPMFGRI